MSNNNYYVGSTNNLERRIAQHTHGYVIATKHYLPVNLLYHRTYATLKEARQKEHQLKQWKNRTEIELFMMGK